MPPAFTQGKYARAICDRCGIEVKYSELREEWTGLEVCADCWDPKTKLEFPTNFPTDPEALRNPRPDNDVEASLGYVTTGTSLSSSFRNNEITVELGSVTVTLS